jgi:hypothetical protein
MKITLLMLLVLMTPPHLMVGRGIKARMVTHYAYGLSPLTNYDVYKDGVLTNPSAQSGQYGTLVFLSPEHGTYSFLPAGYPPDHIPPNRISDLSATKVGLDRADITWTSPGDDNNIGISLQYDIRYSDFPNTSYYDSERIQGEPAPLIAGTQVHFLITGLKSGKTYYFRIRTADEVVNWSDISNTASVSF